MQKFPMALHAQICTHLRQNSQMPRNSELVEAMIPALRGCGESWKTSQYGQICNLRFRTLRNPANGGEPGGRREVEGVVAVACAHRAAAPAFYPRRIASQVLHLPVVLDRLRHWELDALTDDTKRVYLQQLQQTHLYVDWPIACLAGELASPLRHITLPKRLATALRTIKGLLSDDGSELAGDEGDADPAPGAGPPAGPPAPPGEGAQNGPGAPQPVTAGPPAAPAQWVPPSPGAPVCQAFPWRRTGACVALGRRAVRYQSWPGFGFPAPSHGAPRAMASPRGRYKAARLKSWAGPGSEVERAPLPETAGPPPGAPEAVGLGAEGEGLALGAIPRATTLADFLSSLSQTGSPLGQGPLGEQDYAPGLAYVLLVACWQVLLSRFCSLRTLFLQRLQRAVWETCLIVENCSLCNVDLKTEPHVTYLEVVVAWFFFYKWCKGRLLLVTAYKNGEK